MKKHFFLINPMIQQNAARFILDLPTCSERPLMVEIKEKTRSLEQNALLWATLTEVSRKVVWHGRKLTPENWKDIFTAALKKQDVVPNISGDGFVILGQSTSKMSKREITDLIELIYAFGAENGVVFRE
jgi:hypothetical protein